MSDDPLAYLHQAAVFHLNNAAADIADGDGLIVDFDYDEEIDVEHVEGMGPMNAGIQDRTVTLELTYLLPE